VFVAEAPRGSLDGLPELLTWPAAELRRRLDDENSLLQRRNAR
jgi:hypothetical protein